MSTQLSVVLHRIPSYFPRNGSAEERERDAYRAIIDRTTPGWLASALAVDRTFDVTPFGIDDDAFHNHDFIPLAAFVDCPQAIAAGRDHLYAVVDSYAISHCSHRADVWIGSMWVAIYGGQSCCDEPFDGYSSVSALALLPELGMLPAPKTPASLHGEVRKAVQDGMDPVVMEWEQALSPDRSHGRRRDRRARDRGR